MATATLPKPPRAKRSTPTPFTARQKVSSPCGEPKAAPGSYDVFYGPFDSWLNVKSPPAALSAYVPAAVGDGIADDTEAIQAAIDFIGNVWPYSPQLPAGASWNDPGWRNWPGGWPKSLGSAPRMTWANGDGTGDFTGGGEPYAYVVYIPAGTYRITKTLRVYNRIGCIICGEDPRTTIIKYDGPHWETVVSSYGSYIPHIDDAFNEWNVDVMHWNGGITAGGLRRLTLEGMGNARIAFNVAADYMSGGGGMETSEILDVYFHGCAIGIKCGGTLGANDADISVKRCHFTDISINGLVTLHWNALNWYLFDCTFRDCRNGYYNVAGSCQLMNSLFINSTWIDFANYNTAPMAIRGNTSIVTSDITLEPKESVVGWVPDSALRHFLSATFLNGPTAIAGNLVINAQETDGIFWLPVTSATIVDNAFYDSGYLTSQATGDPISIPFTYWNQANPAYGLKDDYYTPVYASGNLYNGEPLSLPTHGPATTTDAKMPVGYVPPNNLKITQTEVRQILQANSSSPVLQELVDRMPQPPDCQHATDADIAFVDLDPQADRFTIHDAITTALANAPTDKTTLIHFPMGGYEFYAPNPAQYETGCGFVVPSGRSVALVGDTAYSSGIYLNPWWDGSVHYFDERPMLTIGTGGAAKCRIDGLGLLDRQYAYGVDTAPGMIQINTGDMQLGRVYGDFLHGQSIGDDTGWQGDLTSYVQITGLDNVKTRLDMYVGGGIHCVGTGKLITSNDDVMLRMYGLTPLPDAYRSQYYVSNGGSMHVYDMYTENVAKAIDLRGGHGYFCNENNLRYLLWALLPSQEFFDRYNNFTGHQIHINKVNTSNLTVLDIPPAGSSITYWGSLTETYNDPSQFSSSWDGHKHAVNFVATGMPMFTNDSYIDGSLMFGITIPEGFSAPANFNVGGNRNTFWGFTPSVTTNLALGMDATQEYLEVTSKVGFWAFGWADVHQDYSQALIQIDDEWISIREEWLGQTPDNNQFAAYRGQYGSIAAPHTANSLVRYASGPGFGNLLYNYPTNPAVRPDPFVMSDIARDALRYRPLRQLAKIENPNVTDVVLHYVSFTSRRPYSITVTMV